MADTEKPNPEYYPHVSSRVGEVIRTSNGQECNITQLCVAYNELVDYVFGDDDKNL